MSEKSRGSSEKESVASVKQKSHQLNNSSTQGLKANMIRLIWQTLGLMVFIALKTLLLVS